MCMGSDKKARHLLLKFVWPLAKAHNAWKACKVVLEYELSQWHEIHRLYASAEFETRT